LIKEIAFTNVKGQTGTQSLSGMDIFIGPNGSGKTTRVQSLELALLGYVPGQGKTSAETFKLATGEEMSVSLKKEDFSFTRTFKKTVKVKRKTGERSVTIGETVSVSPGRGESNDTEKKARIIAEVGRFPVMLDFNEFLALSDAKRRDFIYSLSPINSDSWTRNKIENYLKDHLLTMELEINDKEQYQVMAELIQEVIQKFPINYSTHDGLQAMMDWVATELSKWNGKKKDSQGAVRSIAEAKNKLAETDRNIVEGKKELDELREKLVAIEKQISRDTEIKKAIETRINRINELKQLIGETQKKESGNTAELDERLKSLQGQITEEPNIETLVNEIKDRLSVCRKQVKELDTERRDIKTKITEVNATIKSLVQALNKTDELAGKCILHQMISCPKDFSGFDGFVHQKKEQAQSVIAEHEAALKAVEDRIIALEQEEELLQKHIKDAYHQAEAVRKANRKIEQQVLATKSTINEIHNAEKRREDKLTLYREELDRLTNQKSEPIGEIELMQKQAAGLRTRIAELKTSIEEKEKAKQTILLLQQSMIENKEAEYKANCLKCISDALGPKGVQGEMVKEIIKPIRDDIAVNLKHMGFCHEPYFDTESDTGKEVFQFGWINEKGHKVNFDALSTGQQTVYLAAIMTTIIDRARPMSRILVIDNINHCYGENLKMLVEGIGKLHDKMDNIILSGAVDLSFQVPDVWKVWDIGVEQREEEVVSSVTT